MISFKFKGAKVLINRINKAVDTLDGRVFNIVTEEMNNIESIAKRDVPVYTSDLKNSFFKNTWTKKSYLVIEQGFRKHYAPYQDFGTGTEFKESRYKDYLGYISDFRGLKPANRPIVGKRFLFYPFILGTRKMDRKIGTIVKNLL